ncbi:YceI family protein [Zunongwangia pacifica]|uniref:YceI family protein n=1 Tax=Zunongwangia pacifica TaxID=2911062 RepID=A0A9X1ZMY7_9FLAO|nr:YceI family protein [Zunongwangia pacifica]MCL6216789.1 YceI family protein [Zunongwangia pacifica]
MKNKTTAFTLLLFFCLLNSTSFFGQKFLTKNGKVSFYSHTFVEDIKAENNQVLSIVDLESGEIAINVLMKSFVFEKALMQEHFNENYVESDKYPKAKFSGTIKNLKELLSGEESLAKITGNITIHGVKKTITIESIFNKSEKEVSLKGKFMINIKDYDIKIPNVVRNNISDEVETSFQFIHQPYN